MEGKYDLAICNYNKAIEINPRYFLAWFNKANVYEVTGRKKEAVEAYKAFIQYAPAQFTPSIESARQKIRELGQ